MAEPNRLRRELRRALRANAELSERARQQEAELARTNAEIASRDRRQAELEHTIEQLHAAVDDWRTRAQTLARTLQNERRPGTTTGATGQPAVQRDAPSKPSNRAGKKTTKRRRGLKKEDVKISILDNILTLSGEKKSEEKSENRKYHRSERTYGAFERKYSLASPIQADKVTASFKDGVLEIRVPKAEEAKPKEIQIQAD